MTQELNHPIEISISDSSPDRLTASESLSSACGAELIGRYATGHIFDKSLEFERAKLKELEENGASAEEINRSRHNLMLLRNLALETDAVHQNIVNGTMANE